MSNPELGRNNGDQSLQTQQGFQILGRYQTINLTEYCSVNKFRIKRGKEICGISWLTDKAV